MAIGTTCQNKIDMACFSGAPVRTVVCLRLFYRHIILSLTFAQIVNSLSLLGEIGLFALRIS